MTKDIVPELLESIQKDFRTELKNSPIIARLRQGIKDGSATFKEADEYAVEVGKIMSKALQANIVPGVLPDGKMYFNIADRILNETLEADYKEISYHVDQIMEQLNKNAGLGIKNIEAPPDQDRIDGLINRLASEDEFEKVAWLLDEPIINFSSSIVDDIIKANAEFHAEIGLKPVLYRIPAPSCCAWCVDIAGKYEYPDVPDDIYRRHERCRCRVEYDPGESKRQNVWSKKWS